jgi:DNA repair exonuclease SbcCD ATPase subunit
VLKLKELRFSGIGRFVEEQVINFESLGSMVQVDGQNNNTGGSSGAGKSTIFQALEYLFGINKIPNTVLKSRQSENGIFVQGTFDFDGKALIIIRGKKLKIAIDGIVTEGSSSITEAKLDEILSISRDLFRPMLHKRQKEGGFFLNMTPKDINDFLTSCLGLGHYKSKIENLDKQIKLLNEKKISNYGSLESARSALKATEEAILSLGLPPVRDIHQSVILELKAKHDKSASELASVQAQHKLEVNALELSRPQISEVPFNTSAREGHEKYLKEIREYKNNAQLLERDRQAEINKLISARNADIVYYKNQMKAAESAKVEATEKALEIKKIRDSMCPTCEQGWVTEKAKTTEAMLLEKLKTLKKVITDGAQAAEQLVPATVDMNRWMEERSPRVPKELVQLHGKETELEAMILIEKNKENEHRSAQSNSNRAILDSFAQQQKTLRDNHTQYLSMAMGQAEVDRRTLDAAVSKLRAYDEARTRYESLSASLEKHKASHAHNVDELTKVSVQIHNELAIFEELKRAVKNFLSCSFDEALETISENSTKMIRHIPNMANATIQLEGQKETQDGKIKEEVNAVIHMDGEQNIDIRSLSGGERTSTDLAIDLSVIDLIESRANKGIDLFILDEPFDGLEGVNVEMALEVLKNSNTNKRLIIVDHDPEVKQMVESKLTVVRDGATSIIRQS